ncbi:acyl-CoA N-acyltransferase [Ephemerocybe angulata]|uniref:Acyl-CoA N-acyltransferase n=1 Tax=Ephemerocybe angulata TaxID=980116 RepID=A0A8H6I5Z8_9AGAR|nr:acyl-CoA N-acyltransferase [Tulosesus angulatus]
MSYNGVDFYIRPFQRRDSEQVRNLFKLCIGYERGSPRWYALRGSPKRLNSIICYIIFAMGLLAASPAGPAELCYRIAGITAAVLSAAFFLFHRWQLSEAFLHYSNPASHADLSDIAGHYGVVENTDGTSYFTGKSGFWVAERLVDGKPNGEVVGTVGLGKAHDRYRPDPHHAELRRMAVSSTMQRKGLGRHLVERVFQHVQEHKLNTISLQTTGYSTSAVGFYERFGWKLVAHQSLPGKPWLDFRLVEYRLDI